METERCPNHPFVADVYHCGACGRAHCSDCLVQPNPKKPMLCKWCAVAAAGIRSSAAKAPVRSRREIKQLTRAQQKQAKARSGQQRAATTHNPFTAAPGAPAPPGAVPAPDGDKPMPARTKRLWRTAN